MQNQVQVFGFEGVEVRVVFVNGEPWWVAKDVCEVLGYARWDSNLIAHVPEEWKGTNPIRTPGGEQLMLTLSEQGLYFFLGRSDKSMALSFQRWLAGEVVPSIRKHGMYATEALLDDPEHLLQVTKKLVEEHRARLAAEAEVQRLAPKAEFADAVADSKDAQSIREVAKVLGTGQNRFFDWLRGQRILMADNRPYQDYLDAGYFRVIEQTWEDRQGNPHLTTKTLVTGKGLVWLQKRFHSRSILPMVQ